MPNLIDERDKRTSVRKKIKKKMDSIIGLSYHDEDKSVMSLSANVMKLSDASIRLLDEGYFDNGFVIKKGTLEKFLNGKNENVRGYELDEDGYHKRTDVLNLSDSFTGTVNLGHMDFSSFPFIIGEWKKEDLTLVEIENDRHALDVNLRLDEESVFVKELKRQPHDIGVSAEFYYHISSEDTEALSDMLGYYMPVIDEVFIFAYGLVGECGNVNSSGLELKGEIEMPEETKVLAVDEEIEEVVTETEEIEETIEEVSEVSEETAEVDEEAVELSDEVEADEAEDGEEGEDEEANEFDAVAEAYNELNARVETLEAENASLKESIEALKKTNRRLSAKLQKEKEKKEEFFAKAKGISVKLNINEDKPEEPVAKKAFAFGDGIGD